MNLLSIFDQKTEPRQTTEIIKWWEKKRLLYNLIVGSTGLILLLIINLFVTSTFFLMPHILLYGFGRQCFLHIRLVGRNRIKRNIERRGTSEGRSCLALHRAYYFMMMNLIFGLLTVFYWDDSFPVQD
jgi:hypothetical protein